MTDSDDAWHELYDAIPRGWVVGRPPYDDRTNRWRLYGYDRRQANMGRGTAVTAEAESEEQAIREMTRRLKKVSGPR